MSDDPKRGEWSEMFGLEALPRPAIELEAAPRCYPHVFRIHEKERMVTCSKCDAVFDPFDAIVVVAKHHDRIHASAAEAEKFKDERRKEAAELQREIRNLRSMKKRAGEPLRVALRMVIEDMAWIAGNTKQASTQKLLAALAARYEAWDASGRGAAFVEDESQTGTKGKGT